MSHIFSKIRNNSQIITNKCSVQIAEIPILHSNTVFKCPDLVVHLDWVFYAHMYLREYICTSTCMRQASCTYGLSIINSRKLIEFIAFTYWPESLLQGGIMADWVCTKTGEETGRDEEGKGNKMETRKKKQKNKTNNNKQKKHISLIKWGLVTY